MTIERHAEAALKEYWDAARKGDGKGKSMPHYVARHIQSAIDEETAPLRARIAELEGLGPLIDRMEKAYMALAAGGIFSSGEMWQTEAMKQRNAIDAILKGGAP